MPETSVATPVAVVPAYRLTLGATEVRAESAGPGLHTPVFQCSCMAEE